LVRNLDLDSSSYDYANSFTLKDIMPDNNNAAINKVCLGDFGVGNQPGTPLCYERFEINT
jgi:hypothetical protein